MFFLKKKLFLRPQDAVKNGKFILDHLVEQ